MSKLAKCIFCIVIEKPPISPDVNEQLSKLRTEMRCLREEATMTNEGMVRNEHMHDVIRTDIQYVSGMLKHVQQHVSEIQSYLLREVALSMRNPFSHYSPYPSSHVFHPVI